MSEKGRNEIAGMLTKKEIEDLGAPWLSMAEAPAQDAYRIAPSTSYGVSPVAPAYGGDNSGPLSLEGFATGAAGSTTRMNRLNPEWGTRLRYGRSF
jgi:hypothetical protein